MPQSSGMYLAFLFQLLIALNMAYAFILGDYNAGFFALLMFLFTLVPYWVAKKLHIEFPWFVYLLIALSLWFHTAGFIQGYYVRYYPYYDKLGHLIGGLSVALLGFLGVIFIDRYWRMRLRVHFIVGFTIIFGLAMAAAWEIYEFAIDTVFGGSLAGQMQVSLEDTMIDLIMVLASSVIVAGIAVLWFRHHDKGDLMQEKPGVG
ncbi:MAG: hypothetical protein LUQ49_03765 [Methanomicrobiales archaeon]|nr:hypothetical protein [Methanomicrobiales archaeon]